MITVGMLREMLSTYDDMTIVTVQVWPDDFPDTENLDDIPESVWDSIKEYDIDGFTASGSDDKSDDKTFIIECRQAVPAHGGK